MRRLIASTFISLDGVIQGPGGPKEDSTGGFDLGGWVFKYGDEDMDLSKAGFDAVDRELVLGRKTYEIFAAYWPYQKSDNSLARVFNGAKKHVASRTPRALEWNNSQMLKGDVVTAIKELKSQSGFDLQLIGSANLIQTLQLASLVDQFNLWIFPIVLGAGKRFFEAGAKPSALKLVATQVTRRGIMMNTYEPVEEIVPEFVTEK